jgi:hemerythrin
MALQWTRDLAVGHSQINRQHQRLIERFNALLEACRAGQGKMEVARLLHFLDEYVYSHFSAEERLMENHSFPERAEHFAQHRYFRDQLNKLKADLEAQGPNASVVISANRTLLDWILHHIKQVDIRLGAFLQTTA